MGFNSIWALTASRLPKKEQLCLSITCGRSMPKMNLSQGSAKHKKNLLVDTNNQTLYSQIDLLVCKSFLRFGNLPVEQTVPRLM